ncbi:glucose-1-phosphate cytidylyltransferase [Bacillus subtilis]|uniref:glucose-1-phosphate cytidylyltransferase n=1 Tax=Bacillus subtilis TaxID=1423 RepID=UPI002DB98A1A|nr:glucose-1-phosphate cytidylyltransferase [Bacillus subtilis]MEC1958496.1 glucose-1-phosphate cytidylyltransferase [Bacillus subtilis]
MKAVILCGGKGTRMSEVTNDIPKPLAMIGCKPILWHIMKIYQYYGVNEFILLLGYKGEKIKEYFLDYEWKHNSLTLDSSTGEVQMLGQPETWKITFLETGEDTLTAGRILQAKDYIGDETFLLTYGDGLANINLFHLISYHQTKGAAATVTGIDKVSQFGTLTVEDGMAKTFSEKTSSDGIINGGFFVLSPKVFDYLPKDGNTMFEDEPLKNLAKDGELAVYRHYGFWTAIDTYKNLLEVNKMWNQGQQVWKVW